MSVSDNPKHKSFFSRPGLFAARHQIGQWTIVGSNPDPSLNLSHHPILGGTAREGELYIGSSAATASSSDAASSGGSVPSVMDVVDVNASDPTPGLICVWEGSGTAWLLVYCNCTVDENECDEHCNEPTSTPQQGSVVTTNCVP